MLGGYQRWIFENLKVESVETLREYKNQSSRHVRTKLSKVWRRERGVLTFSAESITAKRMQRPCPFVEI